MGVPQYARGACEARVDWSTMVPWDQVDPFVKRLGKGLADFRIAKSEGDSELTVSLHIFGDDDTLIWKVNAEGLRAEPLTFRTEWNRATAQLLVDGRPIGLRSRERPSV